MIVVKDLIGIPYRDHGRGTTGLDCYGLAIMVLHRAGKDIPDVLYSDTSIATNTKVLTKLQAAIPNTRLDKPEEGAIVEILVMGQPSHVGVCMGDGTFIHALKSCGVVIEPLSRYRHKIKGFYRVHY